LLDREQGLVNTIYWKGKKKGALTREQDNICTLTQHITKLGKFTNVDKLAVSISMGSCVGNGSFLFLSPKHIINLCI
jgi:hypothetical protein